MSRPGQPERSATYAEVFAVAEFRWSWVALVGSVVGDQLARVALSILVFDRTGSAGLSALTYALTLLPDVISGPLLGGLADRYPRRRIMVVCDAARAVLVAAMAIPGVPLWVLCVLLVAVQMFAGPFQSARSAFLAMMLSGDTYRAAVGLSTVTTQAAQLVGFVLGGTIVATLGPSRALGLNALSFAVSAVLLRLGLRERPVPLGDDPAARPSWWGSLVAGARLVWGNRRLRYLLALCCVPGFYITVEGLATPYAASVGAGAIAAGILFAANPAGQVIGILLTSRIAPARRLSMMGPLAIGTCAVLIGCVFRPGLELTVLLWMVSGMCASYMPLAQATFVQEIPDAQRGQVIGLARTALIVAQGMGILVAGAAADQWNPAMVVAGAGVLGVIYAAGAARGYRRAAN